MKIKMNWGTGIVITSLCFMGYIVFLVTRCFQNNIELVDPHYYKEEIEYQQQMNKIKNANMPEARLVWHYDATTKLIELSVKQEATKGQIRFVRPSDASLDVNIDLQTDNSGKQLISSAWMEKGLWRMKVNWSDGKNEYFKEETLIIQ